MNAAIFAVFPAFNVITADSLLIFGYRVKYQ